MDSLFGTPLKGMSGSQQEDPLFGTPLQGTDTSNQNDSIPMDVRNAEEVTGSHDKDGLCEQAVEQWAGLPNMGRTAAEAFNNFASQGKAYQGIETAPKGSLIYFAPDSSNQGAGHVAISLGDGSMISATYQGVRQDNVQNWMKSTGQQPLGFVMP